MRRSRPLLGTFVDVSIPDALDGAVDADVFEAAFEAVATVGRLMSFHDPHSELSAINAAPPGTVVAVGRWTADVLRLALDLHDSTDGAFDCGIGDVLVADGELPMHRTHGDPACIERPGSLRDIVVVDDHHVLVGRRVCLDLGGIAKGYAVDKAIEALRERGISSAVVDAGGDLRVLGDDPQPVHVRVAGARHTLRYLGAVADGAVATSTLEVMAGKCRGGVVDPRTRHRLRDGRTVTVLAPTCAVADGLTKALAVSGSLDDAYLRRYDAVPVVT